MSPRTRQLLLMAVLAGAIVAVYAQVAGHSFVEYDDPGYVRDNPFVRRGLTWDGVRWAFTTNRMGHWHPLTWLSHMLDVQLLGANAGAHLLVNVAFHLLSTLLLFTVWERMTGARWPSFIVAALFAIHPLHVESVAWISERKDVLSTFFWMLTLWSYVRYVETRTRRWYIAALALFALGLMAKPMLVTLPFTLLLLDVWPLRRIAFGGPESWVPSPGLSKPHGDVAVRTNPGPGTRDSGPYAAVLSEKIPFLVVSVIFSILAFSTQRQVGAVARGDILPVGSRLANALVAYVRYLVDAVWPVDLAVLYPLDRGTPAWQPITAAITLVSISAVVMRMARRHPYAPVGWLWYLGTLIPVIGIVQIGSQARADRYTYVPLIGIFVIVAWGGQHLCARWRIPQRAVAALVTALVVAYAVLTWSLVGVWKDSETLFTHALRVTHDNCIIHNNLGVALGAHGDTEAAVAHYREALRIKPDYADAFDNLALALWRQGRRDDAMVNYTAALRYAPESPETHTNLGALLIEEKQLDEAIAHLAEAVRLDPDFVPARINLGNALRDSGRQQEALDQYAQALRIRPDTADGYNNIGAILAEQGRREEAVAQFRTALRYDPHSVNGLSNLGLALAQLGKVDEALPYLSQAVQLAPDQADIHRGLGNALRDTGRGPEAVEQYRQVVQLQPDSANARYDLAMALMASHQLDAAVEEFRQAVRLDPSDAQAHNDLGVALYGLGQRVESTQHFERALQLAPGLDDARRNLDFVRGTHSDVAAP